MISLIGNALGSIASGQKAVIAADWREVRIMSPETSARARFMLAQSNPRVSRSTILAPPDQSLTNLQITRLVNEAQNPNRRLFTSPRAQYDWLAEELNGEELARLAVFLDLPPALAQAGAR